MKTIILTGPAVIAGAVRYPIEGAFDLDDDVADRLIDAGLGTEEQGLDADDADGLDELTLPDLGLIVTKEGVALNGVTKKADIIEAIRTHRATAPAA